jgi:hypothetical protein
MKTAKIKIVKARGPAAMTRARTPRASNGLKSIVVAVARLAISSRTRLMPVALPGDILVRGSNLESPIYPLWNVNGLSRL